MLNFLLITFAVIGAYILGSMVAPPVPLASTQPSTQLPIDDQMVTPQPSHPPVSFWRSRWGHLADYILYYYPNHSPIGHLIMAMHDPEIRAVAENYLGEAWEQIKLKTATVSPEAADKLNTDLEPFAKQTLQEVEERLDQ